MISIQMQWKTKIKNLNCFPAFFFFLRWPKMKGSFHIEVNFVLQGFIFILLIIHSCLNDVLLFDFRISHNFFQWEKINLLTSRILLDDSFRNVNVCCIKFWIVDIQRIASLWKVKLNCVLFKHFRKYGQKYWLYYLHKFYSVFIL